MTERKIIHIDMDAFFASVDSHRLSPEIGIIPLLDGSKEGIHIYVNDLSFCHRICHVMSTVM